MKAIKLLLVSFLVVCFSTTNVVASKSKESDAAKIQRAMKAAPSSISAGATILDVTGWVEGVGWPVLREGDIGNEWTCFPGVPLNPGDKHPMCNDVVWMGWLNAAAGLFYAQIKWTFVPATVGFSYMLRGDALVNNANPGASDQNDGGLWDQEGPHLMMLFPPSFDLSHLPTDPYVVGSPYYDAGGPYVMWGDESFPILKHVMVPLTDRDR